MANGSNPSGDNDNQGMSGLQRWALPALLVGLLLLFLFSGPLAPQGPEVPYTRFTGLVDKGAVQHVVVRGHQVTMTFREKQPVGARGKKVRQATTRVPLFGGDKLMDRLEKANVETTVREQRQTGWWWILLLLLVPWLFLMGMQFFQWRRMGGGAGGGGGGFGGFGGGLTQSKAKRVTREDPTTTFDDVAGQDNAKREVAEVVDFLADPERFRDVGAEAPHGMLMVGPPGTGKTLMARALAGEAGVAFYHQSASEFIEMVVGVGAARVRQAFEEARKNAPAILFIDELDSIGRMRGTGLGGGHDEREQTLNQILSEMDGFSGHEEVVVVAATNRPDVLDPALQRPGRFDRRISLELPDVKARRSILELHAEALPLAADVDIDRIARGTPGFSGADLKNLANEAAIRAAREHKKHVTYAHFDDARDSIIMGSERALSITPDEHYRLAVHESGHTAAAHFLPNADALYKVSIIPRGQALGGTHQIPEEERYTMPEDYLRDRIGVILGGRCAERIFLGTVSSGADDDIKQATRIARGMVTRWGMADDIGPMDLRQDDEQPFLGQQMAQPRQFSDTTAHQVDEAVRAFLTAAEDRVMRLIQDNREAVENLVQALEEEETLDRAGVEAHLGARPAVAAAGEADA